MALDLEFSWAMNASITINTLKEKKLEPASTFLHLEY